MHFRYFDIIFPCNMHHKIIEYASLNSFRPLHVKLQLNIHMRLIYVNLQHNSLCWRET